jgi:quercetin dioxygenase-like cupin family protein
MAWQGREELIANGGARPYALKAGEGWTYRYGIYDFTVKAGELGRGRRLTVVEYTTRLGEEPPDHIHATENEIFYVLQGALTVRCGADTFDVDDGGFAFLPRGIQHGYTIRSDGDVRLLMMTSPAQEDAVGGWGGFVAEFEAAGELRATPPGGGLPRDLT